MWVLLIIAVMLIPVIIWKSRVMTKGYREALAAINGDH